MGDNGLVEDDVEFENTMMTGTVRSRSDLPIAEYRKELVERVLSNKCLVVVGETGKRVR